MKNKTDLITQTTGTIYQNSSRGITPDNHQALVLELIDSNVNIIDDIINDLTTGGTDKALSAEQGVVLAALIPGSSSPDTSTFENSNLNGSYELEINHGNTTNFIKATLLDNNGIQQPTDGIFQMVDADNVKFMLNAPITGVWRYILQYF